MLSHCLPTPPFLTLPGCVLTQTRAPFPPLLHFTLPTLSHIPCCWMMLTTGWGEAEELWMGSLSDAWIAGVQTNIPHLQRGQTLHLLKGLCFCADSPWKELFGIAMAKNLSCLLKIRWTDSKPLKISSLGTLELAWMRGMRRNRFLQCTGHFSPQQVKWGWEAEKLD